MIFSFKKNTVADKKTHGSIDVFCPYCHSKQQVSEGAISSFCKNCKKIFDIKKAAQVTAEDKISHDEQAYKEYSTATKRITCSGCGVKQDVPTIAISAFCKKCGQRINLQDYKKSNLFRGDLETKGTLYITATGNVEGNVSVGEAIIDGHFNGKLVAEGLVKLQPGSYFKGKIITPKLEVVDGATFIGQSMVKPEK